MLTLRLCSACQHVYSMNLRVQPIQLFLNLFRIEKQVNEKLGGSFKAQPKEILSMFTLQNDSKQKQPFE